MNDTSKTAATTANENALTTATGKKTSGGENGFTPVFVEAEKMFERLADLTRETARRAYEFFQRRGGEWGRELDDWFKAEREVLQPVTVEINENKDHFTVRAAVPGFKPEEIEVSVKDKVLILSGETKTETEKKDENTVYSEWRSNRFFRLLPLESEIDAEKVEAVLKDGILQLTLPKLPAREPKQIAVNAG